MSSNDVLHGEHGVEAAVNSGIVNTLDRGLRLFTEMGAEFEAERRRLQQLKNRLGESRFHLAVLGQFKRGKSTLLNALIGEELLPSAVVPLTSLPTFLSFGPERVARVIFMDGHMEVSDPREPDAAGELLRRYVTESGNPKNKHGVERVEIEYPSPILQEGVVLIDTPGIGSTFQHNTEATLNFLPQCDAALFLVSADPPITQVEIEFLKAVRRRVVRTLFAMNKMDYLPPRERLEAMEFFRAVLCEQVGADGTDQVFPVSARLGLQARLTGNRTLWHESGMGKVEEYLLQFLNRDKMQTLSMAISRRANDVLGDALFHLRLKQRSMTLPLEELDKKTELFNEKLREIDQQREMTRDLLAGDKRRITEMLEHECADAAERSRRELLNNLEQVVNSAPHVRAMESEVRKQLNDIVPPLFDATLSSVTRLINTRLQEALSSHQKRASELVGAVQKAAADLFEIPFAPAKSEESIVNRHKPYWVSEKWTITLSPVPRGFVERFLPKDMGTKRVKAWLEGDIEAIVRRNIGNLQFETRQNIDETFRKFSAEFDRQLEEVAEATLGAVREARKQREEKGEGASAEVARLSFLESNLVELQNGMLVGNAD